MHAVLGAIVCIEMMVLYEAQTIPSRLPINQGFYARGRQHRPENNNNFAAAYV